MNYDSVLVSVLPNETGSGNVDNIYSPLELAITSSIAFEPGAGATIAALIYRKRKELERKKEHDDEVHGLFEELKEEK